MYAQHIDPMINFNYLLELNFMYINYENFWNTKTRVLHLAPLLHMGSVARVRRPTTWASL